MAGSFAPRVRTRTRFPVPNQDGPCPWTVASVAWTTDGEVPELAERV